MRLTSGQSGSDASELVVREPDRDDHAGGEDPLADDDTEECSLGEQRVTRVDVTYEPDDTEHLPDHLDELYAETRVQNVFHRPPWLVVHYRATHTDDCSGNFEHHGNAQRRQENDEERLQRVIEITTHVANWTVVEGNDAEN